LGAIFYLYTAPPPPAPRIFPPFSWQATAGQDLVVRIWLELRDGPFVAEMLKKRGASHLNLPPLFYHTLFYHFVSLHIVSINFYTQNLLLSINHRRTSFSLIHCENSKATPTLFSTFAGLRTTISSSRHPRTNLLSMSYPSCLPLYRLWNAARSDCLASFPHGDIVTAVAFHPLVSTDCSCVVSFHFISYHAFLLLTSRMSNSF
jgi:hypothetical protein